MLDDKTLEKIKKALGKIKSKGTPVGFTIMVRPDETDICCGYNYPDSIARKVLDLGYKLPEAKISCSADSHGGTKIKTIYVNGGASDRRWMR